MPVESKGGPLVDCDCSIAFVRSPPVSSAQIPLLCMAAGTRMGGSARRGSAALITPQKHGGRRRSTWVTAQLRRFCTAPRPRSKVVSAIMPGEPRLRRHHGPGADRHQKKVTRTSDGLPSWVYVRWPRHRERFPPASFQRHDGHASSQALPVSWEAGSVIHAMFSGEQGLAQDGRHAEIPADSPFVTLLVAAEFGDLRLPLSVGVFQ